MNKSPKEKAKELVLRYLRIDNNTKEWFNSHIAKQCALFAVDEILEIKSVDKDFDLSNYWQEVEEEINNL